MAKTAEWKPATDNDPWPSSSTRQRVLSNVRCRGVKASPDPGLVRAPSDTARPSHGWRHEVRTEPASPHGVGTKAENLGSDGEFR